MKLILGGGGAGEQTVLSNKLFDKIIDNSKPILYVPLAWSGGKKEYPNCYKWITGELANVKKAGIDMVQSGEELANANLSKYAAIFIGGGNSYELLKILKETKAFDNIKNYLIGGGVVYGGSAGSLIFGRSIDVIEYMDTNEVGLTNTAGFNMMNGASLAPHYTNKSEEKEKIATDFLTGYSKREPVFALPEECSLFIDNGIMQVIGNKDYYIFDKGERKKFKPGAANQIQDDKAICSDFTKSR